MAERISKDELSRIATVTSAPARTKVDRNFGLPTGIYAATVGLYMGFIALMTVLFLNPGLVVPLVIIGGFVLLVFGLAGIWAGMNPENETSPLSWGQFSTRGIQTLSGHLTSGEAMAQVLILPVLIVVWGIAIAVIVAVT
ncbi:MAG: hypothetical protein KUG65_12690 [Sphingomonadaceae bacterium]|nr:hypothetical protein [Sphingomonadaceae bacterium]